MFCKNCGENIESEVFFCKFCGEKLGSDDGQTGTSMPENQPSLKVYIEKVGFMGFVANLFRGRLGRLDYLLFLLASTIFIGVFSSIFLVATSSFSTNNEPNGISIFIFFIMILCMMLLIISGHIRRLHDIQMSGFWVLIFPVPLIGFVFFLILLFSQGTNVANKYGAINCHGDFFKRVLNY